VKYIIDRFEGDYAVCEDENGEFTDIEKMKLPAEAKEGSTIEMDGNGAVNITENEERKRRIAEKMRIIRKP